MHDNNKILAVDLDGSLIKTDSLIESVLLLIKQHFFSCFCLPFVLLKGKAALKDFIARRVTLDVSSLPYNSAVLDYIRQQKQAGARCYLVTGASQIIADQVSEHLQLFDGAWGSSSDNNLTGSKKAQLLIQQFGEKGFAYIGNETVDLPVWQYAQQALVVSNQASLLKKAQQAAGSAQALALEKATVKTYLKAIRLHQWVKNGLIAVPLLTAHQWGEPLAWYNVILGFLSFSFTASSVYVLNDLLDLAADRKHPSKCKRPFASGLIGLQQGLLLLPVLLLAAVALLWLLPPAFGWVLLAYYLLTSAYSLWLKNVIILDSIVLAVLYTLRIVAGTVLLNVDFSFWLLAFSLFIFHSLALVKRYTELDMLQRRGDKKATGRAYHVDDIAIVMALGIASAYIAVLVFSLYVNSEIVTQMYHYPVLLWLTSPVLLYWIGRVWLIAHRGQMHDDPIVFAIRDRQSVLTGLVILLIFSLAL